MDLNEILQGAGGIEAISRELGISPEEAQRGATALLPSVLHGFGDHEASGAGDGGGGLAGTLSALGGEALASNVIGSEPTAIDKGQTLLGHIFGSKDVSRDVATQASQSSGVSAETLKKMLPILALLVGGYLASRSRQGGGGGLGGILGSILGSLGGGQGGGQPQGGGGLGGVVGSVLGSFLNRR